MWDWLERNTPPDGMVSDLIEGIILLHQDDLADTVEAT